jgi:hypothetical protein
MHRQTLELRERVLGKEHPDTLTSLVTLALALDSHEKAEEMLRLALELHKKVLGKEHLDTLETMNSLAEVVDRQSKHEEPEMMHRQTLELKEKVLIHLRRYAF